MAFGRFSDRRFAFGDNLNIMYGLNEAGKSTLHRFIEAMFFGFAKPDIKRRIMTKEYDQYRPWVGDLYGGSLVYENDGRLYRIERSFEKGREGVKVFDETLGEDITGNFGYDKARREVLFAREHLGLGPTVYRNTISISQLGNKSDASLAREIQTRLGNLGTTGDMLLSVNRAEKLISGYMDEIGTEKAHTKEYGKLYRQINGLENDLREAGAAAENLRAQRKRLREMEIEAAKLRENKEAIETGIRICEAKSLLERWVQIERLIGEQKSLEAQLMQYRPYHGFEVSDSKELFALVSLKEDIGHDIEELDFEIKGIEGDMEKVKAEIDGIEGEYKGRGYIEGKLRANLGLLILYTVVILGALYVGIAFKNPYSYILLIPFFILLLRTTVDRINKRKLLRHLEGAAGEAISKMRYLEKFRESLRASRIKKEEVLAGREQRLCDILKKSGVNTLEEYRTNMEGIDKYARLENNLEQIKSLIRIKLDGENIDALGKRAEEAMACIGMGTQAHESMVDIPAQGSNDGILGDAPLGVAAAMPHRSSENYSVLVDDILSDISLRAAAAMPDGSSEDCSMTIIGMTGNAAAESSAGRKHHYAWAPIIDIPGDVILDDATAASNESPEQRLVQTAGVPRDAALGNAITIPNKNTQKHLADWYTQLEIIKEKETQLFGGTEKIKGSLETLEGVIITLPEIEEELSRAEARLWQLKCEREAAQIALDVLREAADEVHREFAPDLNRAVKGITSRITGGKYTDLSITKDLDIMVTAPETGRRINGEFLSGGTVDQLYFALRIAVAGLLSGDKKLPLFLDDCFVQYDWDRLEKVLAYISEEAKERQIILFTCHHREKKIADTLGNAYNYLVIE